MKCAQRMQILFHMFKAHVGRGTQPPYHATSRVAAAVGALRSHQTSYQTGLTLWNLCLILPSMSSARPYRQRRRFRLGISQPCQDRRNHTKQKSQQENHQSNPKGPEGHRISSIFPYLSPVTRRRLVFDNKFCQSSSPELKLGQTLLLLRIQILQH